MAEQSGRPRLQSSFEPVARSLAGTRWFPLWAVVHHHGRRSGAEYATPVAVVPTADKSVMVIGLPWGPKTNWARNVVAAEGATITWKGRDVRVDAPHIVEGPEAAALSRAVFRPVVRRMPAAIVLRRVAES